ncbi:MAG TPA: UDP-N-acetylmuramate dehydrogenase [Fimbriimonadaceae bacterium]|nr:UDP-N-acetylmuramate dehydrogenase [Fimbriimonadaceae bacterium]
MAKTSSPWRSGVPLAPFTTLQAGGPAAQFAVSGSVDELAGLALAAQGGGEALTLLGLGSNVLVSDAGVPGKVVINNARRIAVAKTGEVLADTGCSFQDLFLKTLQCGLRGLEFAVGIPGSLGGALASNAGAYRSAVSEFITELEVVNEGERKWVPPAWMRFSYRDSRLRSHGGPDVVVLRVRMQMPSGSIWSGYEEAREYQRQRISKQPAPASAGSFFKNIHDANLADRLPSLPAALKEKGIVPAGFVIEGAGLRGYRRGAAAFGKRHANFLLNLGGATAHELRSLADLVKRRVHDAYGVTLEEEVLFLGDWSGYLA